MDGKRNLAIKLGVSLFFVALVTSATTGKIIYVDDNATGANDGSSWENAYNYLQDALADANDSEKPVEIRAAQGLYKPDQGKGQTPGDREATFQLINGVTLRGGYAGFGKPDPTAREIDQYETILSGDLAGNDAKVNDRCDMLDEPSRAENSYHVVTGSDTDTTAVLEGFTVTGGNTNGDWPDSTAAGMRNIDGSPIVANCTFAYNAADLAGGGLCSNGYSDSMLVLVNCIFSDNVARSYGAGIYNGEHSRAKLERCAFSGNSARYGAGMYEYCRRGSILTHCTFSGNSAEKHGGGMYTCRTSTSTLNNCSFTGNSASNAGGGLFNELGDPTLVNCIFAGNKALGGAGMHNNAFNPLLTANYIYRCTEPRLVNCTFAGNSASAGKGVSCTSMEDALIVLRISGCIFWDGGDEIWTDDSSSIAITYSNLQGGQDGIYDPCQSIIWGEGNIGADPCFAKPGYWERNLTPDDPDDDF